MSFDKIRLRRHLDILGIREFSPQIFESYESRISKEGGIAKTLAERFPFGVIAKEPPKIYKFHWAEEDFSFLEDMLQTNAHLQEVYKKWSTALAHEHRLAHYRDLLRDADQSYLKRVTDLHDRLVGFRELRIYQALRARKIRFHAFLKQYEETTKAFSERRVMDQIEHALKVHQFEVKIKNSRWDNRIEWPAKPSELYEIREKDHLINVAAHKRLQHQKDREHFFVKTKVNRLEQTYFQNKQWFYTGQPVFEMDLADKRPGKAKWKLDLKLDLELGQVRPGTATYAKKIPF